MTPLEYSLDNAVVGRWHPRRFEGQLYYFWAYASNKIKAQEAASKARSNGYSARIIKANGYDIYISRRK